MFSDNLVQLRKLNGMTQEELAEDIMSLLASFSGKLYGLRSKGNVVNND